MDSNEAENEYRIAPVSILENGIYDGIILAVGHKQFIDMGEENVRALGKPEHILYDLKYILSSKEADIRL